MLDILSHCLVGTNYGIVLKVGLQVLSNFLKVVWTDDINGEIKLTIPAVVQKRCTLQKAGIPASWWSWPLNPAGAPSPSRLNVTKKKMNLYCTRVSTDVQNRSASKRRRASERLRRVVGSPQGDGDCMMYCSLADARTSANLLHGCTTKRSVKV